MHGKFDSNRVQFSIPKRLNVMSHALAPEKQNKNRTDIDSKNY